MIVGDGHITQYSVGERKKLLEMCVGKCQKVVVETAPGLCWRRGGSSKDGYWLLLERRRRYVGGGLEETSVVEMGLRLCR